MRMRQTCGSFCNEETPSTDLVSLAAFKEIIDRFPYSINITAKDGTMVYANDTFFEGVLKEARDSALGKYNIMNEEMLGRWGLKEHIAKAFQGERVITHDLEFPNRMLIGEKYGKEYAFLSIYNDISSFPIFDEQGELQYVVSIFIPVRRFTARDEIVKAKEFIEEHWMEPFHSKQVAKAINLSLSGFLQAFKKETGFTPHDYYMEIKMTHLKNYLMDSRISVAQAFNECGMDYNSHYTSLFKKHTGLTPGQFRKNSG